MCAVVVALAVAFFVIVVVVGVFARVVGFGLNFLFFQTKMLQRYGRFGAFCGHAVDVRVRIFRSGEDLEIAAIVAVTVALIVVGARLASVLFWFLCKRHGCGWMATIYAWLLFVCFSLKRMKLKRPIWKRVQWFGFKNDTITDGDKNDDDTDYDNDCTNLRTG